MLLVGLTQRVRLYQSVGAEQLKLLDQSAVALDQPAVAGQLQDDVVELQIDRIETPEIAGLGCAIHLVDQRPEPFEFGIADL